MKFVKKDPKCATWIDINKPNKWELLSLLIDTPVGSAEEKRILSNLTAAERAGIKILAAHTQPMDRERMGQVLKRAGDGRLRKTHDHCWHLGCILPRVRNNRANRPPAAVAARPHEAGRSNYVVIHLYNCVAIHL